MANLGQISALAEVALEDGDKMLKSPKGVMLTLIVENEYCLLKKYDDLYSSILEMP